MAVVRNLAIALFCIGFFLAGGCNQSTNTVEVDAETQLRLDEYDQMMEEREAAYTYRRKPPAKVVPASTTNGEIPPVNIPAFQTDVLTESGNRLRAEDLLPEARQIDSVIMPPATDEAMAASATTAISGHPEGTLNRFSTPNEVCTAFLKALEQGDHITAGKMLTNVAQLETARANLVLESPGTADSTIEILPAQYATSEKKVAQVTCLLSQPGQATAAVRLTWIMRFQYNGWKISGMSIQLDQDSTPDLLSFENPRDLARIQQSVAPEPDSGFDETQFPGEIASSPDQDDSIQR